MEMKDLGRASGGMETVSSTANKKEAYYPEVTITESLLPGLKGELVGDTVDLVVEAQICGISEYGNGDIDYRFKLKKAGIKKDTETAKS